ncbi:MAG: rod shape-determining protein MreD [Acidaminococcaceae bacterium]
MSSLIWPFLLLLFLSLQTSWFLLFPGLGGAPDFLLLFLVFFAMMQGSNKGLGCGLVLGLVQDVLVLPTFGFHLLSRGLVGYLVGQTKERISKEHVYSYVLLVVLVSIFVKLAYFVVLLVLAGGQIMQLGHFPGEFLIYVAQNAALAFPLWWLLSWLHLWVERHNN